MSHSWGGRIDDIKARLKEAVGDANGDVDFETVMARARESVGKAGSDVDAEALIARVRDAVGNVESKVDADKIRQWVDDVDREKVRGWLDEARTSTASAASFVGEQGERLADRAPGAFDKVVGVAKEAIGDFTGNEELARSGELQHLRGAIESRFSTATDGVAAEAADATDAVKTKREGSAG